MNLILWAVEVWGLRLQTAEDVWLIPYLQFRSVHRPQQSLQLSRACTCVCFKCVLYDVSFIELRHRAVPSLTGVGCGLWCTWGLRYTLTVSQQNQPRMLTYVPVHKNPDKKRCARRTTHSTVGANEQHFNSEQMVLEGRGINRLSHSPWDV